jgi:hypothetical protein
MGIIADIRSLREERQKLGGRKFWLQIGGTIAYLAGGTVLMLLVQWPADCAPFEHDRLTRLRMTYTCSPRLIGGGAIEIATMLWLWVPVPFVIFFGVRRFIPKATAAQSKPDNLSSPE